MAVTVNFGKRAVPIVLAGLLASGSALASSNSNDGPPSRDDLVEQGLPSTSPDGGLQEPGSDPGEPGSSQSSPPAATVLPDDAGDHDTQAAPAVDDDDSGRTAGTSLAKAIIAELHARKSGAPQTQGVGSVTGIPGDQMLEGLIHGNGEPGADGDNVRSAGSGSHGSDGSADED